MFLPHKVYIHTLICAIILITVLLPHSAEGKEGSRDSNDEALGNAFHSIGREEEEEWCTIFILG